jgi:hypothetical protein
MRFRVALRRVVAVAPPSSPSSASLARSSPLALVDVRAEALAQAARALLK